MEPGSIVILAVQNPGEAATVVACDFGLTPKIAIDKYGDQIKQGAFVSLTERDNDGNTAAVSIYVADRVLDQLYLQDNEYLSESGAPSIDIIGSVIEQGHAPLAPDPTELETFTVFGKNDDEENFVAVVSATVDTVHDAGVKAGLVDEGYEEDVVINVVLKGDYSNLETVSI